MLTLYNVNLTLADAYDAFKKSGRGWLGFEPGNHKPKACHATSSAIWVLRYGPRKAPIMYNSGSCFNNVSLKFPNI